MADGQKWERLKKWEMTVVEKNCDNCDRDRNGDKVHPTVILPKKGSIHPFVEVYRPLEQPQSMGW